MDNFYFIYLVTEELHGFLVQGISRADDEYVGFFHFVDVLVVHVAPRSCEAGSSLLPGECSSVLGQGNTPRTYQVRETHAVQLLVHLQLPHVHILAAEQPQVDFRVSVL